MSLQPIYQHLPLQFKENVVRQLNFRARISLQKCSKFDQRLVSSIPCRLYSIHVNLSPDKVEVGMNGSEVELLVVENPLRKELHWKTEKEGNILNTMKSIFNTPRLEFELMTLNSKKNPAVFIKSFLNNFEGVKLNVERLFWSCKKIGLTTGEVKNCVKFLEHFDAGTLKKIEFKFSQKKLIGELMKTEQFKSLEEIFVNSEVENEQVIGMLHANYLRVQMGNLRSEDSKKLIETFLHKNLHSYFKIMVKKEQIDHSKLLDLFSLMPSNSVVETHSFYEQGIYKHRFEILDRKTEKNEEMILHLKIERFSVTGVVCRSDHIHQDTSSVY